MNFSKDDHFKDGSFNFSWASFVWYILNSRNIVVPKISKRKNAWTCYFLDVSIKSGMKFQNINKHSITLCFHIKDKFKKYMAKMRKEQIRLGIYIQILTWKLLLLPFSIHFHKSFYLIPFQKGIHDFPRISSIPTQSDISGEGFILLICPPRNKIVHQFQSHKRIPTIFAPRSKYCLV